METASERLPSWENWAGLHGPRTVGRHPENWVTAPVLDRWWPFCNHILLRQTADNLWLPFELDPIGPWEAVW